VKTSSALKRRILVADDEAFIIATLSYQLRQKGYDVVTATDGQEAYTSTLEGKFDLILSDYQMPELSGFELCVKLKQEEATANVPVIMLTARGHRLSPEEIAQTNIKHLLAKPFSAKELLKCVEETIGPAMPSPLSIA
jgi:two-component system alkaline phosphatase synthesis response regulator PhoP